MDIDPLDRNANLADWLAHFHLEASRCGLLYEEQTCPEFMKAFAAT